MNILVSGLLNIETTVAVRGFPINYYPIDYPFFGVDSAVSGVGFNLAKALTTLSDSVRLLSFLGNDDEGDRVMTQLGRDHLDADGVRHVLKRTPTSVVLYDPDGRRQIYCDLKDIQEQRIEPDSVSLSGLAAAAICNINFNRDLIKAVHAGGVLTATDVHVLESVEDDYNRDFMENADILPQRRKAPLSCGGIHPPAERSLSQQDHRHRHGRQGRDAVGTRYGEGISAERVPQHQGRQHRRSGRRAVCGVPALHGKADGSR